MEPLITYFPFGPPVGHAKLPDELVDDLNKGCDDIIKDEELCKSQDWSQYLVGHVEQELLIPHDIINKWGRWFGSQVQAYFLGYFNQLFIPEQNILTSSKQHVVDAITSSKITIHQAWYIRSFAGDYNPIHTHNDCDLTCVGFLKAPDLSKERKKGEGEVEGFHRGSNGALQLLSNSGSNKEAFFENDEIGFVPKVGNWYLFPANLRHGVYPFYRSGDERRTFSINMTTDAFIKRGHSSSK